MSRPRLERSTAWPSPVPGFARESRGGGAIELGLGAAVLVSVAALGFDLYSRVAADATVARMAATMADYVSLETAPDGDEMKKLGEFLVDHELGSRAHVVYVITAIHQPPGDPLPEVAKLWSEDQQLRFGDATATAELAGNCPRHIGVGNDGTPDPSLPPSLPASFTPMQENEVAIIVEVCARLTGAGFVTQEFVAGDIYRLHALPARDASQVPPAAPVFSAARRGPTLVASMDGAPAARSIVRRHRQPVAHLRERSPDDGGHEHALRLGDLPDRWSVWHGLRHSPFGRLAPKGEAARSTPVLAPSAHLVALPATGAIPS